MEGDNKTIDVRMARLVLLRVEGEQPPGLLEGCAVIDLERYRLRLLTEDTAMRPHSCFVVFIAGTGQACRRGDRCPGQSDLLWRRDLECDDDLVVVAGHGRRAYDDAAALELHVQRRRIGLAGDEREWHTPLGAAFGDAQLRSIGFARQLGKGDDVDGAARLM